MLQFRRTFENEKVQLQELNRRLSHYLSRVKHLEQENACLVKEISAVRNERTFEWEDQYLAELRELRRTVDLLAFEKSKAEVERERLRREFQTVQSLLFEESGMCRDIDGELKACKVQLQQAQAKNADLEDFMIQLENESRLLEEEHRREISHVQNNIYSRALSNVTQTYRAVPPITVEEVEQYALSMSDNCMEMFEVYRKRVEDLEESVRADEAKVEDLRREKNQYAADFEKLRSELEEQKRLQVHLEGQLRNTQDKCKGELEHYQMAVEDLEQERMILTSAITDKLKEHQDLMQVKMGLSLELAAYRALLEGEQRDAYLSAGQYSREAPRRIGSSIVRQDRRPPVNIGFETRCMEQGRSSRTSPGVSRFRSYEGPVATLGRASSRRDVMSCSKTPQVSTIAVRPVLQKYDLKTEIAEEVMVQKKDVSQHSANHQKFIKDFSPLPSPTSDKREIDLKEAHKTCVRVVSPPMMSLMTMSEKEGEEDAGDIKADKSEDRKEADYSVTLEQGKIDEEEEVDAPTIEEVMITTQGEFSDDSQIKEEKESKRVDSAEEKEEGGGSQKEEVTAITQDDFSDDSQINEEKESKRIDPAEEKEEEGGSQKEEVTEITQDDFSDDSQINEEQESKRIDPAEKEEEGGSQKKEVTAITQDDFSDDSQINEEKESKGIDPAEEKEEEGGSQKEEVTEITQNDFSDDSQINEEKESKRIDPAEEKEEEGGSQKEEVTEITQDDFSDDSQINEEKESKRIDPAEEKEEEGGSQKEEVTEITQDDFSNDSQINEEKESKRIDPAEEKEEEGGSQKEEVTEITQDDFSNDSEINEEKESKGIDPAEEKEEEGGSQKEEVTAIIQDDFSDDSEIKEEKESKRIDPAEGKTMATVSLEEIIEKVIKPAGLDAHLSSSPDSKITYHVEKTEAENGTTQIILESKIEEDLDVSDEALEELLNKEVKKVTLEDVKGTAAGSMIENLLSFGLAKGEDLEKLSVNVEIIEEPLEAHSKEDSKVTPTTVFFQSSSKFIQIEELENDPPPPEHYDSGVEELKTSVIAEEYGRVEVQEGLKDTDVTYYSQETEYYVSTPDDDPEEGPLSSSEHCEAVHGLSDETCHQKGPVISQEDSDSQESESKVTYMISELASSEDRDSLCVVEREVQVSPQMQEAMLDVLQEDSEDPKQQLRELLEELQGEVSGELKENVSLIPRNDEEGDGGLSVDIRKVQKDSDENSMTVVAEINVSQTLEGSELLQEQDKDTFEERERSVNVDGSPEEHDRVSRSEECSTPQIDVNNVKIGAPRPQADRSEEISQEGDMKTWQEYTAECAEIIQVLQSKEAPPQLKVNQEETIVYLESREEA
ncbi:neurofilament medium polypeptide-like isoform X4 [Brienomyrus brachyistius]|uniref:neurofilament medium polypeptide-like isoform X4 n=1 Tax=Brienomyrus brachyistius TaxID=42636 RepID=UPI0020B2A369|nr:neurofilament medium polypeptide-like isoform X4 [Brienomyrus brachyistius]